jgi:hypothetical protein
MHGRQAHGTCRTLGCTSKRWRCQSFAQSGGRPSESQPVPDGGYRNLPLRPSEPYTAGTATLHARSTTSDPLRVATCWAYLLEPDDPKGSLQVPRRWPGLTSASADGVEGRDRWSANPPRIGVRANPSQAPPPIRLWRVRIVSVTRRGRTACRCESQNVKTSKGGLLTF